METFIFEFDGQQLTAKLGQTIAEALLSNGITTFRKTRYDQPRGVYCGMGICYECRAIVNGTPNIRTCKIPVTQGCQVGVQHDASIKA